MAERKNKYDLAHLRNLARYQAQVDAIYRTLTKEAASIASGIDTEIPEDLFSFSDYPKTMRRVDALIETYKSDMMKVVVNGVKSEWTLANNKNNEIARQVFGDKLGKLTKEQERRYFKNNDTARDAFLGRKERGLGLSDRVWDYSGKFRKEIEMGVDLCLRKGMPAAEMARELQKYLRHPDELFRRVRDEHGMLTISKAAKDFHPGRGVYRSSYKNALRLAITETNMAYRLADWERWQQMDFVVGIRIQLSNNHTCLGADGNPHPFHDICDELAGEYPKSFKWTGWHPQCRCNAVPILKTVDEKIADNLRKRQGLPASSRSVNSVTRMPKAFTDWLDRNRDRIAVAKSQPYFIRDNTSAVDNILHPKESISSDSLTKNAEAIQYGKGTIEVSEHVNRSDSDFRKLMSVAKTFAEEGRRVVLTPKMSRPPKFDYDIFYASLRGTRYEGKCPDLKIDGYFYELEGFLTDNPKRAFSNMLAHGLKQSDRIIIDKPDLTDAYMKRIIRQRLKDGHQITEVWINESGQLRLLYKKSEE